MFSTFLRMVNLYLGQGPYMMMMMTVMMVIIMRVTSFVSAECQAVCRAR